MATEQGTSVVRTITLLLIFAVTVVAIVVIFAYFNGLFKFVTEGTGSVSITGVFALSGAGSTSGNLVVQVTDTSSVPVVGIFLSCPTSQFAAQNCGGLEMNYNTALVSSSNTLSKGDVASGTAAVQSASGASFTPGVYIITVTVSFGDGTTLSQNLSVSPQA